MAQQRPLWFYISTLWAHSEVAAVDGRSYVALRNASCVRPFKTAAAATLHPRRCFCFRPNSRLNFRRRVLLQRGRCIGHHAGKLYPALCDARSRWLCHFNRHRGNYKNIKLPLIQYSRLRRFNVVILQLRYIYANLCINILKSYMQGNAR